MPEHGNEQDATRLCPTCRMPISILATRCRHCGETVGRPRKEQAELTIEDLGGERQSTYTVSGNVMDALEAFREEEATQRQIEELKRKQSGSWFGRPSKADQQKLEGLRHKVDSGLPTLDPLARDLDFSLSGGSARSNAPAARRTASRAGGLLRTLFRCGLLAAVIAGVVFGGKWGYDRVRAYMDEKNRPPDRVSRAGEMLASGASSVDALKEAAEAYGETASDQNLDSLKLMRSVVIKEIETLLSEKEYDRASLDKASKLANEAFNIDRDTGLSKAFQAVQEELSAYTVRLDRVEPGPDGQSLAVITSQTVSNAPETVRVATNEVVRGRFLVTLITKESVFLKDQKRNNRALKLQVGRGIVRN